MLDLLNMVGAGIFVVFFFGFCIFIHEFGHFIVAKWRGLHIIAFSIGFKKVWGKKYKGVDYRIGCLPFGGYVDLPQIDATGKAKDEDGNPLPPVKPIDRILVAFAGPFFNILFGFFLAFFIWKIGVPEDSPRMSNLNVNYVDNTSPEYKSGLRKNDIITKVNGEEFYCSWNKFMHKILFTVGDITLTVKRDGKEFDVKYTPIENPNFMEGEGLAAPFFKVDIPVIMYPKPNSAAKKAGLKNGDELIEINGIKVADKDRIWLYQYIWSHEEKSLNLKVRRNNAIIPLDEFKSKRMGEFKYFIGAGVEPIYTIKISNITKQSLGDKIGLKQGDIFHKLNDTIVDNPIILAKFKKEQDINLEIKRNNEIIKINNISAITLNKNNVSDLLGITVTVTPHKQNVKVSRIIPDSVAKQAGLKENDIVTSINDISINVNNFTQIILESKGKPQNFTIKRNDEIIKKIITPTLAAPYGIDVDLTFINFPTPWQQFSNVMTMSYKSIRGIIAGVGKKVGITSQGSSLKPRHLSGPLGIVTLIWKIVYSASYLLGINIIILITFSLAILNLLPIPVLDGGHITLALIEMIFKKALHEKIIYVMTAICVTFLLSMMLYVTFYDGVRLFGGGPNNEIELQLKIRDK